MQRREVWWDAQAATGWAMALMDFDDACEYAQRRGIKESFAYSPGDHRHNIRLWREALMRQLLTPAWNVASVEWKRRKFASGQHVYTDTKPERIERCIAEDVAWIAAHPVRQSRSAVGS